MNKKRLKAFNLFHRQTQNKSKTRYLNGNKHILHEINIINILFSSSKNTGNE